MPLTITYKNIITFFYYLIIAAMVLSPVLLSIGMIGLCLLALFRFEVIEGNIKYGLNTPGIARMRGILKKPSFAVLLLFMVVSLAWFYPIGEPDYLMTRLRIKIPFLILPFVFLGLPRFTRVDFKKLIFFMLLFFSIISLGVLINYLLDYDVLTEQIKKGHHIPTPRNHIRYSLLVALTIIGGLFSVLEENKLKYDSKKKISIGLILFLFIFLHLLSVKSGLFVLYACLGFGLLQYIWLKKKIIIGLVGLVSLFLLPIVAYNTIPSFHNKVQYFNYDMYMYQRQEGANYSDAGRIVSLKAGWAIAKENWLLGVGTSNVRQEVTNYYRANYPDYPDIFMPQNQFLFAWTSAGVLGFVLTVVAFFFPLFYHQNYRQPLFLNFYLSIFIIIMIEHALENAVGVAHYLFFLLLFLSYLDPDEGTALSG